MATELKLPINYERASSYKRRKAREQYVREQDGKCHHCGEPLDGPAHSDVRKKKLLMHIFPPNFLKWPVHLHHDHHTGMTIGAVHAYCNGVLFQYHGE